jgi:hypothetical protein
MQESDNDFDDSDSEDDVPLSVRFSRNRSLIRRKNRAKMDRSERKYQYERYHEQFERQAILKSRLGLNPVEVFEKIIDGDVVSLIVEQSNLYSTQKNDHSFFVSKTDIRVFLGVLLLSGYHKLPRERLY